MKKNYFILSFIFLWVSNFSLAQGSNFGWSKQFGGNSENIPRSTTVDLTDNIYITGEFKGTSDFDPGPGVFNLTSYGSSDIFIAKLDPHGNFVWAKQIGGNSFDRALSITVDENKNVYLTGHYAGEVDFDPGPGVFNLTSQGSSDIFIVKLDSLGNFVWGKEFAGLGVGNSLKIDFRGNVYITGTFWGILDVDPGPGIYNLTSNGQWDIFITKLDSSGNFIWAKSIGGGDGDEGNSVAIDENGDIYITGGFYGIVDFDPGDGVFNLNGSTWDIFVVKISSNGDFVWAKNYAGGPASVGFSIATDMTGNVYSFGMLQNQSALIWKLDHNGNQIWAKSFFLNFVNYGYKFSLALDANKNVYTSGFYRGTIDFDPGVGVYNMCSAGQEDAFVSKFDSLGNFIWALRFGGIGMDIGSSVSIDHDANIYATGFFQNTVDFDPNIGVNNMTSSGNKDVFIIKLNSNFPNALLYKDADNDGYGNAANPILPCTTPIGYVSNNTDCNDDDARIHSPVLYYVDSDHDGYGSNTTSMLCVSTAPSGYSTNNTDCNDNDASVHPNAVEICGNGIDNNCNGQVDEGCCHISVSAGSDVHTYFGYPLQQCVTKTAVVTNGNPPFTFQWSLDRPLLYNVITSEGNETFTGTNSATVTACLLDTANLCVKVTDANGCTYTDCATIFAEDVRCFAGNSGNAKVILCHQTGNAKNPCIKICVDQSAIQEHLNHGDFLGNCTANCIAPALFSYTRVIESIMMGPVKAIRFDAKVLPNPSATRFTLIVESDKKNDKMTIRVINMLGKTIEVRTNVFAGQILEIGNNYTPGIYFLEMTEGTIKKQIKLVKLPN